MVGFDLAPSFGLRRRPMLEDPDQCTHPMEARRLGGKSHAVVVCMQCGQRAETTASEESSERGRNGRIP